MSTYWIASRELDADEPIPIGRAFRNTEIFLLDEKGNRADEGEIYIRGAGVTLGYFALDCRTQERFVQNPLNPFYPETVYRSGDMARINGHGELVYLGRRDGSFKHMGKIISPHEIERAVIDTGSVFLSACVVDTERGRIGLAYCGEIAEKELEVELASMLPRHMMPSVIRRFSELPRLENGKCDRARIFRMLLSGEKKCRE